MPEEIQTYPAVRNAKIQLSDWPETVKKYMEENEDYGEGEMMSGPTPAQRDLMETEEEARAGKRKTPEGKPVIPYTGALPLPGRDIPLELQLDTPENFKTPIRYNLPPEIKIHDRMAMARDAGHEWDAINAVVSARQMEAYQNGYTEHQVKSALGFPTVSNLKDGMVASMTRDAMNG